MDIIVNSVGDANCIWINSGGESMMIDCGKKQQSNAIIDEGLIGVQINNMDNFMLSHYHTDHYKLLCHYTSTKKKTIQNFYYPRIPDIQQPISIGGRPQPNSVCTKLMVFSSVIVNIPKNGSPAANIIGLLNNMGIVAANAKALCIGDKIILGKDDFEVIWPPKSFNSSTMIAQKILNAITEIDEIINRNTILKQIWELLDRSYNKDKREYDEIPIRQMQDILSVKSKHDEKDFQEVMDRIKGIANSVSLCIYKDNDLLFLGDLENNDIPICINNYFGKITNIPVTFFVAPHHGTHWDDVLQKIKPMAVLISVGAGLYKHLKKTEYNKICNNVHITHDKGFFNYCSIYVFLRFKYDYILYFIYKWFFS